MDTFLWLARPRLQRRGRANWRTLNSGHIGRDRLNYASVHDPVRVRLDELSRTIAGR